MFRKLLSISLLLGAISMLAACGGESVDKLPFPCSLLSPSELRVALRDGVSSPTSDAVSCQWQAAAGNGVTADEAEYVGLTVEKDPQKTRQYLELRETMRLEKRGVRNLDGLGENSGAFWPNSGVVWAYAAKGSTFVEVQLAVSSEHPPTMEAAANLLKVVYARVGN